MSVYFITCREANAVKIGHSRDPQLRLKEVQCGCPFEAKLEALHPGASQEERAYHGRFADAHIRGEWFRITPVIETIIANNPVPKRPEPKPLPMAISRAAEECGITVPVLAERLGLSVSELRRYEDARKMPDDLRMRFSRVTERYAARQQARETA